MPRKKREIKVGALVKMHRRKEPGLGMVVERLSQNELKEKNLSGDPYGEIAWQYKESSGDTFGCRVKWIRKPSAWESIERDMTIYPESWLQIVGDVK